MPFDVYNNMTGSYDPQPSNIPTSWKAVVTRGALSQSDSTQPDQNLCKQLGRDAAAKGPNTLAVLDIETFPIDIRVNTVSQVADSIAKLNQAVDWIRAGAAETSTPILVSHYGLPTIHEYWIPVNNDPVNVATWKLANDKLNELVPKIDVLCPSIYCFYEFDGAPTAGWEKHAVANINEAKRVGNNKPVVPFMWWRYHDSNVVMPADYLDTTHWTNQLAVVKREAAGCVLWDWAGYNDKIVEGTGARVPRRTFPDPGWPLWDITRQQLP